MTDAEKLEMLRKLADENADTEVLTLLIKLAGDKIKEKLYPLNTQRDSYTVPSLYDSLQVQIALYLYQRGGTYGLMSHTEQGVTDTFASADIPHEFWTGVVPYASVPSKIINPEKGTV